MSDENDLDQLRLLIARARNVVVFTGAGISTESGIPDFRGPQGLWKTMRPTQFQDFVASDAVRQDVWRKRFEGDRLIERAQPNQGHVAVAKLVRSGKASAVITQNVDNLHQDAGVPAAQVIELHGNTTYATCLDCALRYEMSSLEQQLLRSGRTGDCSRCGGVVKSATISFGQAMPAAAMARAEAATRLCDLFIVMGSSLVVYPAASFPEFAKRRGSALAIVNNEATGLDDIADLVVRRPIGRSLAYVVGVN